MVEGVVVGLNSQTMDVVWDVPFMSGITLRDRCVIFSLIHIRLMLTMQMDVFA
jgi:hypothetical protein